jgi:hypothetical protein
MNQAKHLYTNLAIFLLIVQQNHCGVCAFNINNYILLTLFVIMIGNSLGLHKLLREHYVVL